RVRINGVDRPAPSDARRLLSDHLRHDLGLTGTHVGCEHGVCGCCTVLLDGAPVRSCLMLAVQAEGHDVTTVEGLARDGAPLQRVEDDRLLRGHGRFTDDIDEGALECCFVRSPYAHARITSIDVSDARAMPGVVAVYTAADLPFGGVDLPLLIPHPNLTQGRTQRCLASDVVRYAGEAVAFVIAE